MDVRNERAERLAIRGMTEQVIDRILAEKTEQLYCWLRKAAEIDLGLRENEKKPATERAAGEAEGARKKAEIGEEIGKLKTLIVSLRNRKEALNKGQSREKEPERSRLPKLIRK
jgi:transposase-like protein